MAISKIILNSQHKDNVEFTGTEAVRITQGTTAERANAQAGDLRFNSTTLLMEYYDGVRWKSIDSPPVISSVSPQYFGAAGETITITGGNFQSGAEVYLIGQDSTEYKASVVTVNSSTSITFTTTSAMNTAGGANDLFGVKVVNTTSSLTATLTDALDYGADAVFTTSQGSIGNIYDIDRGDKTFTIGATSIDSDDTISLAVTSGSLPTGMSMNTSGVISGTPSQETAGSSSTYNFTVTATVTGEIETFTSTRNFSITVFGLIATTYDVTGDDRDGALNVFTIPAGLTKLQTKMWGGGGGSYYDGSGNNGQGGSAGFTDTTFNVLSGEAYYTIITAGGGGANARAGYGGGGGGVNGGSAGGGASMILSGNISTPFLQQDSYGIGNLNSEPSSTTSSLSPVTGVIAVAGGGGGGGWYVINNQHGGNGGGLTGGAGSGYWGTGTTPGGTQTAGGSGKPYSQGGSYLLGGNVTNNASNGGSGGGGGGFYGGGCWQGSTGGENNGGGGGSGFAGYVDGTSSTVLTATGSYSSYTDTTTRTNGDRTYTNTSIIRSADRSTTAAGTSDSYYSGTIGNGAAIGSNAAGSPGRVVVIY